MTGSMVNVNHHITPTRKVARIIQRYDIPRPCRWSSESGWSGIRHGQTTDRRDQQEATPRLIRPGSVHAATRRYYSRATCSPWPGAEWCGCLVLLVANHRTSAVIASKEV